MISSFEIYSAIGYQKIILSYCYLSRRLKNSTDALEVSRGASQLVPASCGCLHKRPKKAKIGQTVQKFLPPVCLAETRGDCVLSPCPLLLRRWAFLFCVCCLALRKATGTKSSGRWQHLLWETGGWRAPSRAPTSCPSAATLWKPPTFALKMLQLAKEKALGSGAFSLLLFQPFSLLADWKLETSERWKSTFRFQTHQCLSLLF